MSASTNNKVLANNGTTPFWTVNGVNFISDSNVNLNNWKDTGTYVFTNCSGLTNAPTSPQYVGWNSFCIRNIYATGSVRQEFIGEVGGTLMNRGKAIKKRYVRFYNGGSEAWEAWTDMDSDELPAINTSTNGKVLSNNGSEASWSEMNGMPWNDSLPSNNLNNITARGYYFVSYDALMTASNYPAAAVSGIGVTHSGQAVLHVLSNKTTNGAPNGSMGLTQIFYLQSDEPTENNVWMRAYSMLGGGGPGGWSNWKTL
jgi:hypothetical protein